jgi:hypothetical protein
MSVFKNLSAYSQRANGLRGAMASIRCKAGVFSMPSPDEHWNTHRFNGIGRFATRQGRTCGNVLPFREGEPRGRRAGLQSVSDPGCGAHRVVQSAVTAIVQRSRRRRPLQFVEVFGDRPIIAAGWLIHPPWNEYGRAKSPPRQTLSLIRSPLIPFGLDPPKSRH